MGIRTLFSFNGPELKGHATIFSHSAFGRNAALPQKAQKPKNRDGFATRGGLALNPPGLSVSRQTQQNRPLGRTFDGRSRIRSNSGANGLVLGALF